MEEMLFCFQVRKLRDELTLPTPNIMAKKKKARGGSDGKESACKAGDLGLIPGLGRSPGEWNGYSKSNIKKVKLQIRITNSSIT